MTDETKLEVYSPLDGELIEALDRTPPEEMVALVERAAKAQEAWGAAPMAERVAALKRCRAEFARRADEIVEIVRKETGKPLPEIYGGEIIANLELFDLYLKRAPKWLADEKVPINPINYPGKRGVIRQAPVAFLESLSQADQFPQPTQSGGILGQPSGAS